MKPTPTIKDRIPALLGGDTTTLAAAGFLHVALINAPFNPEAVEVPGDISVETAGGLTVKTTTSAVIQVFQDPLTGNWRVAVPAPAGGWVWISTGAGTLPTTLYGFAVLKVDDTVLYGTDLFYDEDGSPKTYTITAADQGVTLAEVEFEFPNAYLF